MNRTILRTALAAASITATAFTGCVTITNTLPTRDAQLASASAPTMVHAASHGGECCCAHLSRQAAAYGAYDPRMYPYDSRTAPAYDPRTASANGTRVCGSRAEPAYDPRIGDARAPQYYPPIDPRTPYYYPPNGGYYPQPQVIYVPAPRVGSRDDDRDADRTYDETYTPPSNHATAQRRDVPTTNSGGSLGGASSGGGQTTSGGGSLGGASSGGTEATDRRTNGGGAADVHRAPEHSTRSIIEDIARTTVEVINAAEKVSEARSDGTSADRSTRTTETGGDVTVGTRRSNDASGDRSTKAPGTTDAHVAPTKAVDHRASTKAAGTTDVHVAPTKAVDHRASTKAPGTTDAHVAPTKAVDHRASTKAPGTTDAHVAPTKAVDHRASTKAPGTIDAHVAPVIEEDHRAGTVSASERVGTATSSAGD